MTERKTPRNTTELPVSMAIQKLKELDNDKRIALAEFHTSYADKARKILLRVPEVVREHVAEQSGADFFSEAPSAYGNIIPDTPAPAGESDVGEVDDGIPERLKTNVPPLRPGERNVVERKGAGK